MNISNFAKTLTLTALNVGDMSVKLAIPPDPYTLPHIEGGYFVLIAQGTAAGDCQVTKAEIVKYSGYDPGTQIAVITERGVGDTSEEAWPAGAIVTQPFLEENIRDFIGRVSAFEFGTADEVRNTLVDEKINNIRINSRDGGLFYRDEDFIGFEDGTESPKKSGSIIKINGSTGYWLRVMTHFCGDIYFGSGDGGLQAAVNATPQGGVLTVSLDHTINETVIVDKSITIRRVSGCISQGRNNTCCIKVAASATLDGLHIEGIGGEDSATTDNNKIGKTAFSIGIHAEGVDGLKVKNCRVTGFKNAGIMASYCTNLDIVGNHVEGTYPDDDIPDDNTGLQQFGIIVYAESAFSMSSSLADNLSGAGVRHAGQNINIAKNKVGNTAIGIMVFPGYSNVSISRNVTFGSFSQHSVYVYPDKNTFIFGNVFSPDRQAVGIKVSYNHTSSFRSPENIHVYDNIIEGSTAPGLSFETFERVGDMTFHISKSSSWFFGVKIINNKFNNFKDIGMSLACVNGEVRWNNFESQDASSSARSVINLRSFSGIIENNTAKKCKGAFVSGVLSLQNKTIFKGNFSDSTNVLGGSIVSFSPGVLPIIVEIGRWFNAGNYVSSGSRVYEVVAEGLANNTPSGDVIGVVESLGAHFKFVGDYSELRTRLDVVGNTQEDSFSMSSATVPFLVQSPLFETSWVNNCTYEGLKNASRISGVVVKREGNNFYNAYNADVVYELKRGALNGNIYSRSSLPPAHSTDFYEKGDRVYLVDPDASLPDYLICVVTGRSGTEGMWLDPDEIKESLLDGQGVLRVSTNQQLNMSSGSDIPDDFIANGAANVTFSNAFSLSPSGTPWSDRPSDEQDLLISMGREGMANFPSSFNVIRMQWSGVVGDVWSFRQGNPLSSSAMAVGSYAKLVSGDISDGFFSGITNEWTECGYNVSGRPLTYAWDHPIIKSESGEVIFCLPGVVFGNVEFSKESPKWGLFQHISAVGITSIE